MEPLTAAAIAALAFSKFLESSVGKAGEKFTEAALTKIDELRQKIWNKFRGNSRAETTLSAIEQGSKPDLDRLAVYLHDVMEDDPTFKTELQAIAQEINAGRLQDNSTMTQNNYDSSTCYQIKNEGGENYMGNITINKT